VTGKERNEHYTFCPRCGAEAQWSFSDHHKERVEIMCPDCGRYEMPREQFDNVVTESVEPHEPNLG
jgi:hypothetical protein